MVGGAYFIIAVILQFTSVARFAICKRVLTHEVKSIAICQLCMAQCAKLLWRGIQFEFCRNGFIDRGIISCSHLTVKKRTCVNAKGTPVPKPQNKVGSFLPIPSRGWDS